jgi:glutathione synthase/RimK-type ligase-like ATP-grasp enzyme
MGLSIPDTLVTQKPESLRRFSRDCRRIIAKPLSHGRIERDNSDRTSLIYTNVVRLDENDPCNDMEACPTLVQALIDKEFDVRITVVDEDVHAVRLDAKEEDGSPRCDIRRNGMLDVDHSPIDIPTRLESTLRHYMQSYGLRFAAIDMALSKAGEWVFFEINPNGQWAWMDICGATNIAKSFVESFARAESAKRTIRQ